MDESNASETIPDLKDIEVKIGRKTPEGLLRWMREEAPSLRGDAKLTAGDTTSSSKETGRKSLDDKIRKLKMEMAHLRSVDVKILHQLLAVHEGIEAVKWLLEERSTLTSRCSSLTSSQYSLGEGPDCSWKGSWSSLQDPNDKLDNISIGSYLDTLADDMDEYCPSSSESVICNTTPHVSEAASGLRTGAGVGGRSRSEVVGMVGASENGSGSAVVVGNGMDGKVGQGIAGLTGAINAKTAISMSSPQVMSEQNNIPVWTKVAMEKGKGNSQIQAVTKANGVIEKATMQTGSLNDKLGTGHGSPKLRPYKNGKIDLDGTCKMNGKMHMEYDAHWRWVQSQEDVTFL